VQKGSNWWPLIVQPDQTSPPTASIRLTHTHPTYLSTPSFTMVVESRHDTFFYHPKRQSPPMRIGVVPKKSDTAKYVVTGIFAALTVVVCSVTIYLWLKYRRRGNYKTVKFNEASGQAWKLDDQLPQNPTPGEAAKPVYGGKGGHDAGPEQEQGLLANAADPGHAPGPSNSPAALPHSHSNSSFHSATSTPGRISYDSKGQRISLGHDPNCPVHSSHHGQPYPVHSRQGSALASGSGLRPSSYMPPPASTYNTAPAPPTNPNFYAAQQAQAHRQSIPKINSPPPQYVSRPGTAQAGQFSSNSPPSSLVPGPPTTPKPQHHFTNPYNHNRRPSATGGLLPLYLPQATGGQAESYFDANNPLETPVVMNAERASVQRPRELSVGPRGRERELDMSMDTLTPGGRMPRERRLSIGVPVIARTRSGRRQMSVDSRHTPMWTDERGRLSVLQADGVGRERPRGRSVSPRRSFEMEGSDVGESLLGRQYRAWGDGDIKQ
jgi:hypothetical protein